jgi:histone acetyltransferase SAS3
LDSDIEPRKWRCQPCIDNGVVEAEDSETTSSEEGEPARKPAAPGLLSTVIQHIWEKSRGLRKRKSEDADSNRPTRRRRVTSDASAGAAESDSDEDRPTRPRRQRKPGKPLTHIVSNEGLSLIISINADPVRVANILSKKPKRKYKPRKSKMMLPMIAEPEPPHYPALPTTYNANFLPLFERDGDESKSKPYGGILSETDADTVKTFPIAEDRKRFEEAREKAEEEWKKKMADTNNVPEPTKPSQKMSGPPSKIKCINFGGFEIDTWNAAPYPEEYSRNKILYICEFCLKYMNSDFVAWRHKVSHIGPLNIILM